MALTNNVQRTTLIEGYVVPCKPAAAGKFYKGALVNFNAAGLLVPAADTAGTHFAGVVKEYKDAALTDDIEVVRNGVMELPLSGAAVSNRGDDVFATADDTIATSATNVERCGIIVDVPATDVVLVDMTKSNQ